MRPFDQSDASRPDQHLPEPLPAEPFTLVASWLDEATRLKVAPNPNAFTLATIDPDGRPAARILLCKGLDPRAGWIEFFTNYTGRKGLALGANPRAAACFFWDTLDRQVRIEGTVARCPEARSDEYFASRPWESRIGAWSSDQSRPIQSRAAMAAKVDQTMRRFGIDPANPPKPGAEPAIPRPPHWGGFRLTADRVELWVSGIGRVHDRAVWARDGRGEWSATRLQP